MNYTTDGNFHRELLCLLARRMRPRVYVELGTGSGATIQAVAPFCRQAIGVDILQPAHAEGWTFVRRSTAEAFASGDVPVGVELALVDADHRSDNVMRDLSLLWPLMADNGIVVLHDTYPEGPEWLGDSMCSDSWKVPFCMDRNRDAEFMTLPCPPGVTLIRKRKQQLHWLANGDRP